MSTGSGMHMATRGSGREHATSEDDTEEEDTLSVSGGNILSRAEVDTTGWCALPGPSVKCEDGWWRSCEWCPCFALRHTPLLTATVCIFLAKISERTDTSRMTTFSGI